MEDLKPRSHLLSIIGTAIAVGTTVWGASAWLNNRAEKSSVEKVVNDSFSLRLDVETIKGDIKASNIRSERMEKGIDELNKKMDRRERRER